MSLEKLNLKATLDTSSCDLIQDFFVPALSQSVRYDRGVGYFSSGWISRAAEGMVAFARNSGKARWVISPILAPRDWEALRTGSEARGSPDLYKMLERSLDQLGQDLKKDTLSALAWMIADSILEFRLALPRGRLDGDFHDKFGIFTDAEGNLISFNGSYNDSIQGLRNYESIKVFASWKPELAELVTSDVNRFGNLWNNLDPNVRVYELPEAARERILQLREPERPYPRPEGILSTSRETTISYRPAQPMIPGHIVLRDYQIEAIEAWFLHGCMGRVEMATGAGKTFTALAASARLHSQETRLAVIIAVPFQHLVDQWKDDSQQFGFRPILAYESKERWLDSLGQQVSEYNAMDRRFISVITTHATFITKEFQESIASLNETNQFLRL